MCPEWEKNSMRADLPRRTRDGLKLDMSQQCDPAAWKSNNTLGCMNREAAAGREGNVLLYSALVRSHLECCIPAWSPRTRKSWSLWSEFIGGYKDAQRVGAPLLQGQAEVVELDQPGEEKALRRPYCGLSVLMRSS